MAQATFVVTPADIQAGAFFAKFGTSPVDLGSLTTDGITIRATEEWIDSEIDQYGTGPVKRFNAGATLEWNFSIVEYNLQFLRLLLPQSLRTIQATPAKDKLDWPQRVSGELSLTGELLTLHPVGLADADLTQDIAVVKAAFTGGVETTLTNGVRAFAASGIGLRDTANIGRMLTFGDTTATGTPT